MSGVTRLGALLVVKIAPIIDCLLCCRGSQEERISMLKIALAEKGIPLDGHYGIDFDRHLQQSPSMHPIVSNTTPHHNGTQPAPPSRVETVAAGASAVPELSESEDIEAHDDGGIDL